MVATGYVKGFPDLFVCEPRGKYHGLFIELKRPGGKVSPEQIDWIKDLNRRGYYAIVCKGFDSARNTLDLYLSEQID
jgi:hypothetical protein